VISEKLDPARRVSLCAHHEAVIPRSKSVEPDIARRQNRKSSNPLRPRFSWNKTSQSEMTISHFADNLREQTSLHSGQIQISVGAAITSQITERASGVVRMVGKDSLINRHAIQQHSQRGGLSEGIGLRRALAECRCLTKQSDA
jgi:hypothetical protein